MFTCNGKREIFKLRYEQIKTAENDLNWNLPGEPVLNKSLFGEAPPRGPTPYPIFIPFSTKKVLYSFRTPPGLK